MVTHPNLKPKKLIFLKVLGKLVKISDQVLKLPGVFDQHTMFSDEYKADVSETEVPNKKYLADFTYGVGKEQIPEKFFREPETIKYQDNYPGIK